MSHEKYIAVDWGTTNRRAWLIDGDGRAIASFDDDLGLMSVPAGRFEAAANAIRDRLGDHDMVLAGMVGSDKGWRQAPYCPCPAGLAELAANILWIDARTAIVPGLCQTEVGADVMRGEEVQALGAFAAGRILPGGFVCHPGTHAKWIRLDNGRIAAFRTMMTGELFSLLRNHSILQTQLNGPVAADESFRAGVADAFAGAPLLSSLFAIRARHLLNQGPDTAASFASGLLIGNDVRAGLADARRGEKIAVIGRPDLCDLYAAAIESAGYDCEILSGEQSFQAGIHAVVNQIRTG